MTTIEKRLPPRPPRFVALLTVTTLASLGLAVVAPVLGAAAAEYRLSESAAALLLAAFAAGRFAFTAPAGFLADRFRFGAIAAFAMAAITASATLSAILPPFSILLAAQVVQGAGSAVFTTSATSWLLGVSDPAHAGRILTLFQSLIVAVYSFSPLAGGIAGDAMGVRGPFVLSAVAGGLGLLIALVRLLDVGESARSRADGQQAPPHTPPTRRSVLLSRPVVAAAIVGFATRWLVTGLQNTMFPLFGADELGMSSSTIGALLTVNGLAMLVALPMVGRQLDHVGRRPVMRIGMAVGVVSAVAFVGVVGVVTAAAVLILTGFARAVGTPTPMVMASDSAGPETRGRVLGFVRSGIELGGMIGPATGGLLLQRLDYVAGSLVFAAVLAVLTAVVWQSPETRPGGARAASAA